MVKAAGNINQNSTRGTLAKAYENFKKADPGKTTFTRELRLEMSAERVLGGRGKNAPKRFKEIHLSQVIAQRPGQLKSPLVHSQARGSEEAQFAKIGHKTAAAADGHGQSDRMSADFDQLWHFFEPRSAKATTALGAVPLIQYKTTACDSRRAGKIDIGHTFQDEARRSASSISKAPEKLQKFTQDRMSSGAGDTNALAKSSSAHDVKKMHDRTDKTASADSTRRMFDSFHEKLHGLAPGSAAQLSRDEIAVSMRRFIDSIPADTQFDGSRASISNEVILKTHSGKGLTLTGYEGAAVTGKVTGSSDTVLKITRSAGDDGYSMSLARNYDKTIAGSAWVGFMPPGFEDDPQNWSLGSASVNISGSSDKSYTWKAEGLSAQKLGDILENLVHGKINLDDINHYSTQKDLTSGASAQVDAMWVQLHKDNHDTMHYVMPSPAALSANISGNIHTRRKDIDLGTDQQNAPTGNQISKKSTWFNSINAEGKLSGPSAQVAPDFVPGLMTELDASATTTDISKPMGPYHRQAQSLNVPQEINFPATRRGRGMRELYGIRDGLRRMFSPDFASDLYKAGAENVAKTGEGANHLASNSYSVKYQIREPVLLDIAAQEFGDKAGITDKMLSHLKGKIDKILKNPIDHSDILDCTITQNITLDVTNGVSAGFLVSASKSSGFQIGKKIVLYTGPAGQHANPSDLMHHAGKS